MPMDFGLMIDEKEPVRLLDAVLEELDYTELLRLYSPKGRKSAADPVILFKIFVFAMLEGVYSLRGIQRQCEVNLQYKWLLRSYRAPSHMAFGRFLSRLTIPILENLLAQYIKVLAKYDSITFAEAFIDGTKLEANANRYSFVWKKRVIKALEGLPQKLAGLCRRLEEYSGVDASGLKDKELLAYLSSECEAQKIAFVHGTGRPKHPLQKFQEEAAALAAKRQEYEKHLVIMGERNSYSKTDQSATFMRMKDDHMRNGQLKPAYNVQLAVESEYILGAGVFPNPTDTRTLIPFLQKLEALHKQKIGTVVADAGYDSEENLSWLYANDYASVIKPRTYEKEKKRSYALQIGLVDNMAYDANKDEYTCAQGRQLVFIGRCTKKNRSGYVREGKVYQCHDCTCCQVRQDCQKTRDGKEAAGSKKLFIAEKYLNLLARNKELFQSPQGAVLRTNRSIQVEGAFGVIKEDFRYKRLLRRGAEGVYKELLMLIFGFNMRKLHNRIQSGRIGTRLFGLKAAC